MNEKFRIFFLSQMNEKGLFYDSVCPIWQAVILDKFIYLIINFLKNKVPQKKKMIKSNTKKKV